MKILVPVDGSPASIHAVKFAIDQVKTVEGAGLVIVTVQNFATLGLADGAGSCQPPGSIRKKLGRPRKHCERLSQPAARQAFLTRPARNGAQLRQRLIVSPAKNTWSTLSWEPEDWAGCAACCLARWPHSFCI